MEIVLNAFADGDTETIVTYVVAYLNPVSKKWNWRGEYEEIEEAKECMERWKERSTARYEIFERIKHETISMITIL